MTDGYVEIHLNFSAIEDYVITTREVLVAEFVSGNRVFFYDTPPHSPRSIHPPLKF